MGASKIISITSQSSLSEAVSKLASLDSSGSKSISITGDIDLLRSAVSKIASLKGLGHVSATISLRGDTSLKK